MGDKKAGGGSWTLLLRECGCMEVGGPAYKKVVPYCRGQVSSSGMLFFKWMRLQLLLGYENSRSA
jgi:hypothetical protein